MNNIDDFDNVNIACNSHLVGIPRFRGIVQDIIPRYTQIVASGKPEINQRLLDLLEALSDPDQSRWGKSSNPSHPMYG